MKSVHDYILKDLNDCSSIKDLGFEDVFLKVKNINGKKFEKILIFLDKILNVIFSEDSECSGGVKLYNVSINSSDEELIYLIDEFVILKLFDLSNSMMKNNIDLNDSSYTKIQKLIEECNSISLPANKFEAKKLIQNNNKKKDSFERKLQFFKKFNKGQVFAPLNLINMLRKDQSRIAKHFEFDPYCMMLDNLKEFSSYNLINTSAFQEIKRTSYGDDYLFRSLRNLVFLDSHGKSQVFNDFNCSFFDGLNHRNQTYINKILVFNYFNKVRGITYVENYIERLLSTHNIVDDKRKFENYLISAEFINSSVGEKTRKAIDISFLLDNSCTEWTHFLNLIQDYESLDELKTFRLISFYSLSFNHQLAEIIINEIFENVNSTFLSKETLGQLRALDLHLRLELKLALESVLNQVHKNSWVYLLRRKISTRTKIIFNDKALVHVRGLYEALHGEFLLNEFISWKDLETGSYDSVLILDYRVANKYSNTQINLIEYYCDDSSSVKAIFISFFYEKHFASSIKNYNYRLLNIMSNRLSDKAFDWKDRFSSNDVEAFSDRIELSEFDIKYAAVIKNQRIVFKDQSEERIGANQFVVFQDKISMRVERFEDVKNNILNGEVKSILTLNSLPSLYEKIEQFKRNESDSVLENVRSLNGLSYFSPEAIWKELLLLKVEKEGVESVYRDLGDFLKLKNENIVDLEHFKKHWINLSSELLIPRKKKIFFYVCDYVGLVDKAYALILLRLKNVQRQKNYDDTVFKNQLLIRLIQDHCFNENENPKELIEKNKKKYLEEFDFDEFGINEKNVVDDLEKMIFALKSFFVFKEIARIEED